MGKEIVLLDINDNPLPSTVGDFSYLDDPDDAQFEVPDTTEFTDDYAIVRQRDDDIDQATADYLLTLMNVEADIEDLGITRDLLTQIEDTFELILAQFGISIYRPFIYEDGKGGEIMFYNSVDGIEVCRS